MAAYTQPSHSIYRTIASQSLANGCRRVTNDCHTYPGTAVSQLFPNGCVVVNSRGSYLAVGRSTSSTILARYMFTRSPVDCTYPGLTWRSGSTSNFNTVPTPGAFILAGMDEFSTLYKASTAPEYTCEPGFTFHLVIFPGFWPGNFKVLCSAMIVSPRCKMLRVVLLAKEFNPNRRDKSNIIIIINHLFRWHGPTLGGGILVSKWLYPV